MNAPYIHLAINHLPIVGVPLLAVLLAWGIWRRSRDVLRVALGLTTVLAVASVPVFLTGEPAEESLEDAAWVDEELVERHEDRAKWAFWLVLATGTLSAAALWSLRGNRQMKLTMPSLVFGLDAGIQRAFGLDSSGWRRDPPQRDSERRAQRCPAR